MKSFSIWIGLAGGVMAGLAFVLPVTQIKVELDRPITIPVFDKTLTALDLLQVSDKGSTKLGEVKEKLINAQELLENARQKLERPKKFKKLPPLKGREPPLVEVFRVKGKKVKATAEIIDAIFYFTRLGLYVLLGAAIFPVLAIAVWPARFGLSTITGLVGFALFGTLLLLLFYLGGLDILGKPLPILLGYWLALGGTAVMALAGLASLTGKSWKWSLPVQILPALAWSGYFYYILFG